MNLSHLSNVELTCKLEQLCRSERELTLSVLHYLMEIDNRRLYAELGYSSLFDFCVRKLKYSEAGAGRRVSAARVLKTHPELAELLLSGKVTLCSISAAAESIKNEKLPCEAIVERSAREVRALVAPLSPKASAPREVVRPVAVKKEETPLAPQAPVEERYEIRFSVTKEVYEQIEEVKNRLSNGLGKEPTMEGVVKKLVTLFLTEKKERVAKASTGRHIPSAVKREVFKRDGGRCTYCSPDGTRCTAKRYLNFDHRLPFSLGGKSEASNLRLLCSAHNQHEARRILGAPQTIYYQR